MECVLLFSLNNQTFALPLECVEFAIQLIEITPLPSAPAVVSGVMNVRGRIIPVFNLRKRFELPDRDFRLTDQLIIARTKYRTVALHVDCTVEVVSCPEESLVDTDRILPHLPYIKGVVKRQDGIILIHDLDAFLSLEETAVLDRALEDYIKEEHGR